MHNHTGGCRQLVSEKSTLLELPHSIPDHVINCGLQQTQTHLWGSDRGRPWRDQQSAAAETLWYDEGHSASVPWQRSCHLLSRTREIIHVNSSVELLTNREFKSWVLTPCIEPILSRAGQRNLLKCGPCHLFSASMFLALPMLWPFIPAVATLYIPPVTFDL